MKALEILKMQRAQTFGSIAKEAQNKQTPQVVVNTALTRDRIFEGCFSHVSSSLVKLGNYKPAFQNHPSNFGATERMLKQYICMYIGRVNVRRASIM